MARLAKFYGRLSRLPSNICAHTEEEKIFFITPDGVYCYRVFPFGLKNAGATYTWMISRMFQELLGKSMAAYIDDIQLEAKSQETVRPCNQSDCLFLSDAEIQLESKFHEMCIHGEGGIVPKVHGYQKRDRAEPLKGEGHPGHAIASVHQRPTTADRITSCTESLPI